MTSPIVNLDDLAFMPRPPDRAPTGAAAERYEATVAFIGPRVGAKKLGYNITAVPSGKRAFPFHSHQVNEEMFFILQGSGELRLGAETFPVRQGDFIACPAGGPETAHQLVNTGQDELRYLAVSTPLSPDIAEYPETGRFGLLAEVAPKPDGTPRVMMFIGREDQSLPYWEGA